MEDYCKYHQQLIGEMPPIKDASNKISRFVNYVMSFLGLRFFWRKTFHGLTSQVMQLRRQGELIEALNVLLEGLAKNHYWKDHANKWWHLMYLAVNIAQNLQLGEVSSQYSEPLQRLLKLSTRAPQPWHGYQVAYCFCAFSLWSFAQKKFPKAIEQVNVAVHADLTWGYPEYLLGWYGLVLEGMDPVSHFVKAVHIDSNFFQKLKQDPFLHHFPEVLAAINQRVLIENPTIRK